MNVNDVRNMELNQWVFWVTAVPLTFIIITLCLVWAGELGNFWSGFSNLWKGKSGTMGKERGYYGPLQDSDSMLDARADRRERYDPLFRRKRVEYPLPEEY